MSGSGKLASTTGEIVGAASAAAAVALGRAGAADAATAPVTDSPSATRALVTAVARARARVREMFMGVLSTVRGQGPGTASTAGLRVSRLVTHKSTTSRTKQQRVTSAWTAAQERRSGRPAATRRSAYAAPSVATVWCALRPLGLGSSHARAG